MKLSFVRIYYTITVKFGVRIDNRMYILRNLQLEPLLLLRFFHIINSFKYCKSF